MAEVVNVKTGGGGSIDTIEKLKDVPLKTIEALLEGLSSSPADFAVLGLGFIVGYEGIDIMSMLTKPITDGMIKGASVIAGIADSNLVKSATSPLVPTFDLAAVPMSASGIADLAKIVSDGMIDVFPNKHITPATANPNMLGPGVSYFGPPPEGQTGPWPPVGTTLSNLEDQRLRETDPWREKKLAIEQWWIEHRVRIVMGAAGALIAYALTRPGVAIELIKTGSSMFGGAGLTGLIPK